jgi:hypothetical protein
MRMPAWASVPVKAALVNWLPWSVLKMSGLPKRMSASSSAPTQNDTSIVFDSRHASTARLAQSITATVAFAAPWKQRCRARPEPGAGRPPYDPVLMSNVLVLQTLYTLSDDQSEYQLKDRLSFMRFIGLALHDPVPDAKTIWLYREQLARAGAAERLFARFDALLREAGWRWAARSSMLR